MQPVGFYLGIVQYVSFPEVITGEGPILQTLKEILKINAVRAIEISWVKDKDQRKSVKKLLHSWGGKIVFAGSPVLALTHKNLSSLEEPLRMDSIEKGKQIIDEACYLGAHSVLLISGEDPGSEMRKEAKTRLVDSILKLDQYARSCNDELKLTLEPADRDIHRRQLLGPIAESLEVIREIRQHSSNISLTIDMSHLAQLGEDKKKVIQLAKGYFNHVHLANAVIKNRNHPRFGDEHPRFGIKDGEHDEKSITQFIRALRGIDFFSEDVNDQKPIISLEVKPDQNENPSKLMKESIDTFLRAYSAA